MEGEYTASAVQWYLDKKAVKHEITTSDIPQHTSVTERQLEGLEYTTRRFPT